MYRKTGEIGVHTIIATIINLIIGCLLISMWFFYYIGKNEFLFISGILWGSSIIFLTDIVLIIIMFRYRKKLKNTK